MAIDFKKIIKGIFIKEESDPSKGLKFIVDPAAGANTTTTIIAEQAVDVLLSLPGEDSELLGSTASQDVTNKSIDADQNTIINIDDADIKVGAAIDAAKLADGSVSNAEYQYLANVTSDIQTQLNNGGTNLTNHLNDASDAHDASAISNIPSGNLAATDQQAANNELQSDIDLRLLKAGDTMSGNLNMGSNLITSLAAPVSGTDATNKNYVDGIAAGLDPKESVRVASTVDVGGSYATTPSNGQFTGAATSVDGVALSVSDRVLIKDQADAKQNGIYVYSAAGEFTRSADMDGSPASEVSGGNFVFVAEGATQSASGYVLIANGVLTLNTDNLVFTQFSGGANSANKTLSNLDSPTAINQDLIPDSPNARNLGSTANNFFDTYTTRLKDPSNVTAFHTDNRQLLDTAGNPALSFSSATALNVNSRKLSSLANPGSLTDAINKQTAQNYLKNFIQDGDAEGTQILSVYNDSSTTRPVDGTGGTQANLAVSISSTSPLSDSNSFLFTKSGSTSTQGSGASIPFTLPSSMKAKVAQIEFEYIVNSGTFVAGSSTTDSDVIAYIFDVTNSQLIEPSSIKFLSNSSTISDKFIANFQTSATGTSYRLILHCATTSAANYELKLDNFKVSPCNYVYGTPVSDWVSYTPTGSWSTNTTYTGRWRRVGDTLEAQINLLLAGAPTAADLTVNFLPPGLSVDSSKMSAFSFGSVGDANIIDSGTRVYIANPAFNGGSSVYLVHTESGNTGIVNATNPTTFASADNIRMNLRFPITGWSSSVQVSDGYDGREISLRATNNSSTTIATSGDTLIPYTLGNGVTYDKVNGLSSSIYTVPSSGRYKITAKIFTAASQSWTNGDAINLFAMVDNSTYHILGSYLAQVTQTVTNQFAIGGSTTVDLVAGQNIRIKANAILAATKATAASLPNYNSFEIEKLQSPTTISATEVVAASYNCDTGQTLTSAATIKFNLKVVDTHNAYNTTTGVFTAPYQGLYEISGQLLSINATSEWTPAVRKNNSGVIRTAPSPVFNTGTTINNNQSEARFSSYIVQLNAGEVLDFYNTVGIGVGTLYASSSDNYMSIKRIK